LVPPPVPNDVAELSPEKAAPGAPVAEIYYPQMINGHWLDDYHILVWPQPWLSPNSMLHWPVLLDIDRTPFVAWDRRVGQ
jgi:hypothetical protein